MNLKQQFIDWLRQSGYSDDIILAALLEQNIIQMPELSYMKNQEVRTDDN